MNEHSCNYEKTTVFIFTHIKETNYDIAFTTTKT